MWTHTHCVGVCVFIRGVVLNWAHITSSFSVRLCIVALSMHLQDNFERIPFSSCRRISYCLTDSLLFVCMLCAYVVHMNAAFWPPEVYSSCFNEIANHLNAFRPIRSPCKQYTFKTTDWLRSKVHGCWATTTLPERLNTDTISCCGPSLDRGQLCKIACVMKWENTVLFCLPCDFSLESRVLWALNYEMNGPVYEESLFKCFCWFKGLWTIYANLIRRIFTLSVFFAEL